MFIILKEGINNYYTIKDPTLKSICLAMILVAFAYHVGNYPQEAIVQFPSNTLFYLVAAIIVITKRLDNEQQQTFTLINFKKIKGRDIIIVGQQPWDVEIGSNCKNIALEFSKHNRVLYVNSALDRVSLLKGATDSKIVKRHNIIKHKEPGLVQINPSMWNLYPDTIVESINWIKIHAVFKFLNRINNERFAKSILNAIQELGFSNYSFLMITICLEVFT